MGFESVSLVICVGLGVSVRRVLTDFLYVPFG